jgi:Ca-activated chloride channel family protein
MFKFSSKAISFALAAMLAAMLASFLMENIVALLPKAQNKNFSENQNSSSKLDIILSIDISGSMEGEPIDKARDAAVAFVKTLDMSNSFITLIAFNHFGYVLVERSNDSNDLISKISNLSASGGTNGMITFEKAETLFTHEEYRPIIVTLTDGVWSNESTAVSKAQKLIQKGVTSIAIGLKDATGRNVNEEFLKDISSPNQSLSAVNQSLQSVFVSVAKQIKTLQGSGYDTDYSFVVALVFLLWTGVLSYAIAFILIYLQNRYLKKEYPITYIAKKVWINFVVGCIAYLIGDFLFDQNIFGVEFLNRLSGWLIMGAMIGASVSKTVPNYPLFKAIQGGLIGGALGGIVYQLIEYLNGDFLSRLLGAMALGFFIGLMIAIFENMSTIKQIMINWGPKDTSYVSLGTNKILLASHLDADVFLPKSKNPEGHSYSIYLEGKQVYCENLDTYEIFEISNEKPLNLNGMQVLTKH